MRCKKCGHCCRNLVVELSRKDLLRIPYSYVTKDEEFGLVMAQDSRGYCKALDKKKMICKLHKIKPDICSEFEAGEGQCLFGEDE